MYSMRYLEWSFVYLKSSLTGRFLFQLATLNQGQLGPPEIPGDNAHQSSLPFPKLTSHKARSRVFQMSGESIPWCTSPIPTMTMAAKLAPMILEGHK